MPKGPELSHCPSWWPAGPWQSQKKTLIQSQWKTLDPGTVTMEGPGARAMAFEDNSTTRQHDEMDSRQPFAMLFSTFPKLKSFTFVYQLNCLKKWGKFYNLSFILFYFICPPFTAILSLVTQSWRRQCQVLLYSLWPKLTGPGKIFNFTNLHQQL